MVVLGLGGCGIGAWGMYSLNGNLSATINKEIDLVEQFPRSVVSLVEDLADEANGLKVPLGNFTDIIVNKVKPKSCTL
jgi:hypothetical protein